MRFTRARRQRRGLFVDTRGCAAPPIQIRRRSRPSDRAPALESKVRAAPDDATISSCAARSPEYSPFRHVLLVFENSRWNSDGVANQYPVHRPRGAKAIL